MIASLCLLSVRRSAEQCLAVSCTWVLTWEQVGIDTKTSPPKRKSRYLYKFRNQSNSRNLNPRRVRRLGRRPLGHMVIQSIFGFLLVGLGRGILAHDDSKYVDCQHGYIGPASHGLLVCLARTQWHGTPHWGYHELVLFQYSGNS
jgi:hypothetical protein